MRRFGPSADDEDPFLDPDRLHVTAHPDDEAPGRRRWFMVAGAGALAVVLAGGLFALTRPDTPGEGNDAERVALSADGLPIETTSEHIAEVLPVARAALAGQLPAPQGVTAQTPDVIPARVLAAYRRAEATLATTQPSCRLSWWVLAGVGKVSSNHANHGSLQPDGNASPPIRGPRLDGTIVGTRRVTDSDEGRLDGDALYDRAMGPLQLVPSTWELLAADGNGDGVADPDNVDDAAVTAGAFLCSSGQDLASPEGLARGLLSANDRVDSAADALRWGAYYRGAITPPAATPAPSSTAPVVTRSATTGTVPLGATPAPGTTAKPAPSVAPQQPAPAVPRPKPTKRPVAPKPTTSQPTRPTPPTPQPPSPPAPEPPPPPAPEPEPPSQPAPEPPSRPEPPQTDPVVPAPETPAAPAPPASTEPQPVVASTPGETARGE